MCQRLAVNCTRISFFHGHNAGHTQHPLQFIVAILTADLLNVDRFHKILQAFLVFLLAIQLEWTWELCEERVS